MKRARGGGWLRSRGKVGLNTVIVVPFSLLILVVGVFAGVVAHRSGAAAARVVAARLCRETADRGARQLESFLSVPLHLLALNAGEIGSGAVSARDPDALRRRFWEQARSFDEVTSVSFGNPDGGLVNAGREGPGGSLYVISTRAFAAGRFFKDAVDERGTPVKRLSSLLHFDSRSRPWYRAALEKKGFVWSGVYPLFTGTDLALAPSRPVYDAKGGLLGVVTADVFASHIGQFLRRLPEGLPTTLYLVERSGLMVASSTGERPFTVSPGGGPVNRLAARDCPDRTVSESARVVERRHGGFRGVAGPLELSYAGASGGCFLRVQPFRDEAGIDWVLAVVLPESSVLGKSFAGRRSAAFFVLAAIGGAVLLGLGVARWIANPIWRLSEAADALSLGKWEPVSIPARYSEARAVARAFNRMSRQLRSLFEQGEARVDELARAEQRFRELAEHIQEVFWISDASQKVIEYVSPRFEEVWGRPVESLYENPTSWLDAVVEPDRAAVRLSLSRQGAGTYDEQYRIVRPDGEERWIRDRAFPVFDGEGRLVRITGFAQDITDAKRSEEQRKGLEENLRQAQKMEAIGTLAGGIAHDFNNILTPIMAHGELALLQLSQGDPVRDDIAALLVAAERAASLVGQILSISRKEEAGAPVAVNVGALVKETVKFLRASIPSTIEICTDVSPGCGSVLAEPARLHQVLLNLCTNASYAMAERGGVLTVLLAPEQPVEGGRRLKLTVSDTGPGIPEELLGRIFEPYFTTKPVGKGSGLGLAVVHGIVTSLGGEVRATSTVGEGAVFEVWFPETENGAPSAVPARDPARGSGQRVLAVDDEQPVRAVLTRMFEALGYRVTMCATPGEALEAFRADPLGFDAVFTDYTMPGLTGTALAAELKALRPELPVILGTGFAEGVDEQSLAKAGLFGPVTKPYSAVALGRAMRTALGGEG